MKRLALVVAIVCIGSPAFADDETAPVETLPPAVAPAPVVPVVNAPAAVDTPAEERPEGAPRFDLLRVNVGPRMGFIKSSGFDTFAADDAFTQFSIDATYPVFTRERFVVGVGLGWDAGARSGKLRDLDTSLSSYRFYVPIEARYHFTPWLFGFGKIAPGATALSASIKTPTELSANKWAFSTDVSVGASILMGPRKKLDRRIARFWISPEFGYGLTADASLAFNRGRDEKDVLGSDESLSVRSLAMSGFFWRATVGVTF